ncbi:HAD-IA family hydrolase [Erwinia sp. CPCC 100877]|nr:HAD-IA family hydrolase [Erwinia sp. CPCC 100877]
MGKAVIFDMDGVLIDSETYYFKRRMQFLKEKGIKSGSTQLADFVGKTEAGIWETMIPANETLRQTLRKEYHVFREQHPIQFEKALRTSTIPTLKTLKRQHYKLGLASSSPRSEIDQFLQVCHLKSFFDYVISGEELEKSKPDPAIYLLAQKQLNCEKCFAVEDSTIGIAAAKAAELYTLALKQDFPVDQKQADIVITDLLEIAAIVAEQ